MAAVTASAARELAVMLARAAGVEVPAVAPLLAAFLACPGIDSATVAQHVETSVRIADGSAQGGRLLLERVDLAVLSEIARLFGQDVPPGLRAVAQSAVASGFPLLAGWQQGPAGVVLKAYLNATEGDRARRAAVLGNTLSLLGIDALPDSGVPHVLGVNEAGHGACEVKVYVEHASLDRAAQAIGGRAIALAARVQRTQRPAGALVVYQAAAGSWQERAFVAGIAAPVVNGPVAPLIEQLPDLTGIDATVLQPAWPCSAPVPTFLAVALRGDPVLTLYGRPLLAGAEPPAPRPAESERPLCAWFIASEGEVSIGVAPHREGARTYATVAGCDVSYRVLAGQPRFIAIDRLMAWALARLAANQGTPSEMGRALASAPPPPWSHHLH